LSFPFTIQIGGNKILWHVLLEAIGFIAGYRYFVYLRAKQSDTIDNENRTWILIGATFGALLGSRLIGGLENPPGMLASKNILAHFYENKTIVGGLLGGLFGVEVIKKIIGEKQKSGDLFTYPIILGMMIGRIGCFSMGVYEETYGTATMLPWGMNLGDGVLRHPVALYEIFFLGCTWIFLVMLENKFGFTPGTKFKLFLIFYLFFRLMLDFIKPNFTFSFGLSTIQLACIVGLIYYSPFIFNPKKLLLTKPKYT